MEQTVEKEIVFTGDHKKEFVEQVDKLIDEHIEDRAVRVRKIDDLIESYVEQTGKRPVSAQLERLGSYILFEELEGDTRPDKMTLESEPIMTEAQTKRRYKGEVSDEAFAFIGNDGKNHREPTRRPKTTGELIAMDTESRRKKDEQPSKVTVTGGE
jgi:hypothetical protein